MLDILFVQNYYWQHIGIMCISALLKQHGFTTDVTIGSRKEIVKKILQVNPRVVGFYCTTGFHHKNLAAAAEIKKIFGDKILTIIGGPHPTFVPETIEAEGVDMICQGEGEYAVLELMEALRDGKNYLGIKNLIVKKDGRIHKNELRPLCDINLLPFPDREIYQGIKYIYEEKRQEVMLSRGCYYDCSYCANHAYRELYKNQETYVRFRSISNVMDELQSVQRFYHPACFFFHDDVFVAKKDYSREFLETYKRKINLPYMGHITADQLTDDLAKLFKETGCHFISFGVETGNPRLRNALLNKKISDEMIAQCAALLHRYKIPFATYNMIGLPGETLREACETVYMNLRLKPSWACFFVYQPLPKTKLAQYAMEQGCARTTDVEGADATFHENSVILRNNPDGIKMIRLMHCANLMIKIPFLKNLIEKILLNLPLDGVFRFMYNGMYFIYYYLIVNDRPGVLRALQSLFVISKNMKDQER